MQRNAPSYGLILLKWKRGTSSFTFFELFCLSLIGSNAGELDNALDHLAELHRSLASRRRLDIFLSKLSSRKDTVVIAQSVRTTHVLSALINPYFIFERRTISCCEKLLLGTVAPCGRSTFLPRPASRSSRPRSFSPFFRIASAIASSERCQLCCNIRPSFYFASESSKPPLSLIIFAQAGLVEG